MRNKKILIPVCICVGVAAAAAVVVLLLHTRSQAPDIRDTPLPLTITTDSALSGSTLADAAFDADALGEAQESQSALLFGESYPARIRKSAETYTTVSGLAAPERRFVEYLDTDGSVLYTSVTDREDERIFASDGTILFSAAKADLDVSYAVDTMHWFYRAGNLACGELCFYDDENTGAAYYDADGALLCVQTELFSQGADGMPQTTQVYYDNQFAEISQSEFEARIPQVDADAFLYFRWAS